MHRTIAILGAGFCGAMTAAHLLRRNPGSGVRVVLVERAGAAGRGLAYGTWDDSLLLNVPAGNMSAFADAPGDFLDYVRTIDPSFNAGAFLPRRIYGDYLEDTLAQAARLSDTPLEKIAAEAVAVRRSGQARGFTIDLAGGRALHAEQVVLALGHLPPASPAVFAALAQSRAFVANPWDLAALDRIDGERPVVILGTGHTAVDALFRLTSRGDDRKVVLVSRRGLLPHGHRQSPRQPAAVARPAYLPSGAGATALGLLRAVRAQARQRATAGSDWRDVINEMRPHIPALWSQLADGERHRFVRRLLPYWNVHRHRLAPAAHLRLQRMLASGQVEIRAGRVESCALRDGEVHMVLRGPGGAVAPVRAGTVVNCSGPDYDVARAGSPLLRQLREAGLACRDPASLGLDVDGQYRLVGRDGGAVRDLYYVGPMLRARYWEAVAVPELRVHCEQVARRILADGDAAACRQ